ncbi:MAG TPA: SDR family oxidoreductase, partial [Acidimicrobiales bacterium]|nr:SDR family oxidoreductase [Acidimicrobiales bacterium]
MTLPAPSPDSTCVVTGASSGIGAEIARQLATRRRGVTLVARRAERLQGLADELSGRHGVRAEIVPLDLSDPHARAGLLDEVAGLGLVADVLVNNAGFSTTGPVDRADPDAECELVRTNVEAVVDLCTRFVSGMVERGRGAILNVASTAAFQPIPGQAAYGGSKAFVLAYSQALAAELRSTGVTVTALCPGPVSTEFEQRAGFRPGEAEGALPRFMWMTAEEVSRLAVDGIERGRQVVIPGAANQAGAAFARLTPRRILLPLLARQHPALKR